MASMNTRLNIENLDGNIVQKHGGSKQVGLKQLGCKQVGFKQLSVKQVGFKQLGSGVETGVYGVHDEKRVWFESGLSKFFGWLASVEQRMLEPVKVRNMGFNESGEYKKTFIGSGVGMGLMQMLQGVEFDLKPQEDQKFEVEPHGNVDHEDGSQEVQTQDLMEYQLAHDMEQHFIYELFEYREDSNEASFVVVVVDKIYAHESFTFNDTVACEVISRWKIGLKEDMDVRSDVYVLSNGCRKSRDDSHNYYWKYAPVGSQEYQVVCTRPGIASSDVDILDGFDRGLQTNIQVFVDFDYAKGRSITITSRSITGYRLMILGFVGRLKANLQHTKALSTTESRYMTFTEGWKKEI
ncbi:hypothetical protein Tco_1042304 [Tanacetum coccineum]|uniref:Zinc finger, CCHC-type n=1 Tax=Tanacetum coccineum TaxID=301880 RepID=A0ABQ5GJF9_9ASTR